MQKELTKNMDPWPLYLDGASLQWAADCWPANRFLDILFSESTEKVEIFGVSSVQPGKPLDFKVTGRCYGKVECSFRYKLDPKELTNPQAVRLRELVKVLYRKEAPNYPMAKRICKALGVVWK